MNRVSDHLCKPSIPLASAAGGSSTKDGQSPRNVGQQHNSTYLAYSYRFVVIATAPTVTEACAFVQYLSTFLCSPGSVAKYVSAVTVYVRYYGVLTFAFNSHWMGLVLDAVACQKLHRVSPLSDPLTARTITWLHNKYGLAALNLGIQLMFYAGLRQSDVVPRSAISFDPTITLPGEMCLCKGVPSLYPRSGPKLSRNFPVTKCHHTSSTRPHSLRCCQLHQNRESTETTPSTACSGHQPLQVMTMAVTLSVYSTLGHGPRMHTTDTSLPQGQTKSPVLWSRLQLLRPPIPPLQPK